MCELYLLEIKYSIRIPTDFSWSNAFNYIPQHYFDNKNQLYEQLLDVLVHVIKGVQEKWFEKAVSAAEVAQTPELFIYRNIDTFVKRLFAHRGLRGVLFLGKSIVECECDQSSEYNKRRNKERFFILSTSTTAISTL